MISVDISANGKKTTRWISNPYNKMMKRAPLPGARSALKGPAPFYCDCCEPNHGK